YSTSVFDSICCGVFFSSRRRHTRSKRDWSSDVCSSDLIGALDEHGFLFLKDRTSDMIISGGYNVYPREVEDALLTHTAVDEAVVVGTPDDQWVEAVTAVVVLADGVTGDDALRTELISHVAARIASYKKPRNIVFRDAIPKTAIGKLDRKQLRVTLAEDS